MKTILIFLAVLTLTACNSQEAKEESQNKILHEEPSYRTKTKVYGDSLKVIYKYSGDTIFEDHIDLKGTSDDNYDSSLSMTTVWSTREMPAMECDRKLSLPQDDMIFSYCLGDVIQKIETDIKNSQDESWKSDRLQRLKKELKEIENGERDSLTFKPYHLNFLILKDLDYSAFDKVSKQKAHKMKIGKYFMEFTGGNSSGGTHYYFITKENDTIAEFRIREWIT
ncbi:hypothetical protein ACNKXS_05500 [Christiangramia marina]|uniref:hypothetical protein n=1 Tax=Christiangramia marina TaxID=409436 RepID=UPI003AA9AC10